MYHPRLKGSYAEMGKKYGALLYKNGFIFPNVSNDQIEFGKKSYPILQDFYPGVCEEIKAFSEEVKVREIKVAAFLLSIGVTSNAGQCSILAVNTKNGVIFGRNYDFLLNFKKFTESSLICPDNKLAYISQSDVFIGREDGVNAAGLAIAMTTVIGKEKQQGVNFYFIVRYILEHCQTTEEAVDIIANVDTSQSNNFLIADKAGSLAVVEKSPRKYAVRKSKDVIFCTNHFLCEEMEDEQGEKPNWSKTEERLKTIDFRLSSGQEPSIDDVKDILCDTDGCVCLNLKKENFGTLWSIVSNLNTLSLWRCEGIPKVQKYKEDTRLNWWLSKQNRVLQQISR
ncbi:MAG: C45 family peptidase [Cyanobacteria bacterium P01_H01_bin.21]